MEWRANAGPLLKLLREAITLVPSDNQINAFGDAEWSDFAEAIRAVAHIQSLLQEKEQRVSTFIDTHLSEVTAA